MGKWYSADHWFTSASASRVLYSDSCQSSLKLGFARTPRKKYGLHILRTFFTICTFYAGSLQKPLFEKNHPKKVTLVTLQFLRHMVRFCNIWRHSSGDGVYLLIVLSLKKVSFLNKKPSQKTELTRESR